MKILGSALLTIGLLNALLQSNSFTGAGSGTWMCLCVGGLLTTLSVIKDIQAK